MRNNVIGPRKPKELSKSPWECKVKEKGRGSPRKANGLGTPKGKTNETQEFASDVIKEPIAVLSHWEKNKRQAQKGPPRLKQNSFAVGMMEWYGRR